MCRPASLHKLALAAFIITTALLIISGTILGFKLVASRQAPASRQQTNVPAGSGFPVGGQPAPDFTLTNQFGQTVTLSSLKGHEVVLAFIDARCTSICPLTAKIMYDSKARLKPSAASQVELIAVNANPTATGIPEVQSWSIKHGMLHQWLFLTGSAKQLQAIYHSYQVYDQVGSNGESIHDPILYIIDAQGREQLYFETLNSSSTPDLLSQETALVAGMQQWLPSRTS